MNQSADKRNVQLGIALEQRMLQWDEQVSMQKQEIANERSKLQIEHKLLSEAQAHNTRIQQSCKRKSELLLIGSSALEESSNRVQALENRMLKLLDKLTSNGYICKTIKNTGSQSDTLKTRNKGAEFLSEAREKVEKGQMGLKNSSRIHLNSDSTYVIPSSGRGSEEEGQTKLQHYCMDSSITDAGTVRAHAGDSIRHAVSTRRREQVFENRSAEEQQQHERGSPIADILSNKAEQHVKKITHNEQLSTDIINGSDTLKTNQVEQVCVQERKGQVGIIFAETAETNTKISGKSAEIYETYTALQASYAILRSKCEALRFERDEFETLYTTKMTESSQLTSELDIAVAKYQTVETECSQLRIQLESARNKTRNLGQKLHIRPKEMTILPFCEAKSISTNLFTATPNKLRNIDQHNVNMSQSYCESKWADLASRYLLTKKYAARNAEEQINIVKDAARCSKNSNNKKTNKNSNNSNSNSNNITGKNNNNDNNNNKIGNNSTDNSTSNNNNSNNADKKNDNNGDSNDDNNNSNNNCDNNNMNNISNNSNNNRNNNNRNNRNNNNIEHHATQHEHEQQQQNTGLKTASSTGSNVEPCACATCIDACANGIGSYTSTIADNENEFDSTKKRNGDGSLEKFQKQSPKIESDCNFNMSNFVHSSKENLGVAAILTKNEKVEQKVPNTWLTERQELLDQLKTFEERNIKLETVIHQFNHHVNNDADSERLMASMLLGQATERLEACAEKLVEYHKVLEGATCTVFHPAAGIGIVSETVCAAGVDNCIDSCETMHVSVGDAKGQHKEEEEDEKKVCTENVVRSQKLLEIIPATTAGATVTGTAALVVAIAGAAHEDTGTTGNTIKHTSDDVKEQHNEKEYGHVPFTLPSAISQSQFHSGNTTAAGNVANEDNEERRTSSCLVAVDFDTVPHNYPRYIRTESTHPAHPITFPAGVVIDAYNIVDNDVGIFDSSVHNTATSATARAVLRTAVGNATAAGTASDALHATIDGAKQNRKPAVYGCVGPDMIECEETKYADTEARNSRSSDVKNQNDIEKRKDLEKNTSFQKQNDIEKQSDPKDEYSVNVRNNIESNLEKQNYIKILKSNKMKQNDKWRVETAEENVPNVVQSLRSLLVDDCRVRHDRYVHSTQSKGEKEEEEEKARQQQQPQQLQLNKKDEGKCKMQKQNEEEEEQEQQLQLQLQLQKQNKEKSMMLSSPQQRAYSMRRHRARSISDQPNILKHGSMLVKSPNGSWTSCYMCLHVVMGVGLYDSGDHYYVSPGEWLPLQTFTYRAVETGDEQWGELILERRKRNVTNSRGARIKSYGHIEDTASGSRGGRVKSHSVGQLERSNRDEANGMRCEGRSKSHSHSGDVTGDSRRGRIKSHRNSGDVTSDVSSANRWGRRIKLQDTREDGERMLTFGMKSSKDLLAWMSAFDDLHAGFLLAEERAGRSRACRIDE